VTSARNLALIKVAIKKQPKLAHKNRLQNTKFSAQKFHANQS